MSLPYYIIEAADIFEAFAILPKMEMAGSSQTKMKKHRYARTFGIIAI
jgi:hypothetical protein